MATFEKRSNDDGSKSYRVKIRIKGYQPESASFERLADAKTWASKTESDIKASRHFGQSKRHTFDDLADKYEPSAKDKVRLD